jgi:hypothetical protein
MNESISSFKAFFNQGKGSGKTLKDLAELHDVSVESLEKELQKGLKVEREHTSDPKVARKIAMDHLTETPDYYTRLEKAGLAD